MIRNLFFRNWNQTLIVYAHGVLLWGLILMLSFIIWNCAANALHIHYDRGHPVPAVIGLLGVAGTVMAVAGFIACESFDNLETARIHCHEVHIATSSLAFLTLATVTSVYMTLSAVALFFVVSRMTSQRI